MKTGNKLAGMILALGCAPLLAGCVDVGDFELTKNEEETIAGYCADILLKYDTNHQSKIVDTSLQRELNARVEAIKELNAQMEALGVDPEEEKDSSSGKEDKSSGEKKERYAASGEQNLAAALGQEGFGVSYTGYEVCDAYPHNGEGGNFFAMEATPGKELVVLHFDINNVSGEDKKCDFLSSGVFYRVVVNGSERKNALSTILLNDMATVDEDIPAGGRMDAVVVLETEKGYADTINSLTLLAKYGESESVIPLTGGSAPAAEGGAQEAASAEDGAESGDKEEADNGAREETDAAADGGGSEESSDDGDEMVISDEREEEADEE